MSGVVSDNTDKQSGLIKTPVLGPDSGSSNPGIDENPSAVGARFINTTSGEIRLKEDIQLIGKSPSSINIYSFKYKGEPDYYEGVMAQEVPWVSTVGEDGFLRVDYSKIDVNFKKILRKK